MMTMMFFLAALFKTDDLFYSKMNAMKFDFAYLCNVLPNGYSICDDHFMHMFDINSIQTESFNLVTIDNPKNILLAYDLTHDEKEKMKETLKRRQKLLAWATRKCQVSIDKSLNTGSLYILIYHQQSKRKEGSDQNGLCWSRKKSRSS